VGDLRAASVLILAPDGAEPPVLARAIVASGGSARVARALTEAAGLLGAAAAAGETYDAVLIDQRMAPDAARTLALVREAAGGAVPAAILIEPGRRGAVEAMRAAGYGAYLVRPVRRESLMRIVADLSGGRGATGFAADPGDVGAAPRAAPRPGATLDVLLAEDNEINALLARAVLEGMGHHVVEVRDGNAAVAAARGHAFPVILMDLHMPGLDGLAAAREIRAHEKKRGSPPAAILAVTADVLDETRAAVAAAGIDRIVEKPMTPDVLRRALAEVMAPLRADAQGR
jgi:CheY-like chemotaxis protein